MNNLNKSVPAIISMGHIFYPLVEYTSIVECKICCGQRSIENGSIIDRGRRLACLERLAIALNQNKIRYQNKAESL